MSKSKIPIIVSIFILFCIVNVILFNYISDKQYNKKNNKVQEEVKEPTLVDVDDANNVPIIDAKLGSDIKITQSYLMNYIIKKQGIWYMSYGYVKNIKKTNNTCTMQISEDKNSKNILTATISIDKCKIKVNSYVYFVGTIDIQNGYLDLSKIALDKIDYTSVTELSISDLINNIELVRNNKFIVSGFLVTKDNEYLLYDSKNDYTIELSNYFVINWKDEFNYTGNQSVVLTCNIGNSYTLNNCFLNE